jgi:hypothetical protein
MESNGEPGKVNISSSVYELIKDKYTCTYRGKVYAKNVGEIDMYFVDDENKFSQEEIPADAFEKTETKSLLKEKLA